MKNKLKTLIVICLIISFVSCEKREAPIACISVNSSSFNTVDSVEFESCSENAHILEWDLGDGSEIKKTSYNTIKHIYKTPGTYTIKLKATEHAMWYKSNLKYDEITKTIEVY